MANFLNIDNLTYCGKEASEIISKSVFESKLYNYGISILANVRGKQKINIGELSGLWQADSCEFTPSGNVTLNEDLIEPVYIKINMEECYDKWATTWMVVEQSVSNPNIPSTFSEWFMGQLSIEMMREFEQLFWNGDTTSADTLLKLTDGIIKKLTGTKTAPAATYIKGTGFTIDNIVPQIDQVWAAIPAEVRATNDIKIFMNVGDVMLLKAALGKQSNQVLYSNYVINNDRVYAYGIEVIGTLQAVNTIIASRSRGLVLGVDLTDDSQRFEILDLYKVLGEEKFRVIARASMAVGTTFVDEAVILTTNDRPA